VKDPGSDACAIVDSVLDFDYVAGRITYVNANFLIARVRERGLRPEWLIETHVHADHLSAAPYIRERLGGQTGIVAKILAVQENLGKIVNEEAEFQRDGSQFDRLFDDGASYWIGTMTASASSRRGTRRTAWPTLSATQPSWATPRSCRTGSLRWPTSLAEMPARFMTPFRPVPAA